MQLDPTKPKLKPPGTERSKLNCDVLLSTSAFKINLRRYTTGGQAMGGQAMGGQAMGGMPGFGGMGGQAMGGQAMGAQAVTQAGFTMPGSMPGQGRAAHSSTARLRPSACCGNGG